MKTCRLLSRTLSTALLFFAAAGCSQREKIDIYTVYGPGVRVEGIGQQYAWLPTSTEPGETALARARVYDLIRSIVDGELSDRGFVEVQADPDFLIAQRVATREKSDASVHAFGVVYEVGALILEFHDPEDQSLIWRGIAEARIDPSMPPEQRVQRINSAVHQLLDRFFADRLSGQR